MRKEEEEKYEKESKGSTPKTKDRHADRKVEDQKEGKKKERPEWIPEGRKRRYEDIQDKIKEEKRKKARIHRRKEIEHKELRQKHFCLISCFFLIPTNFLKMFWQKH